MTRTARYYGTNSTSFSHLLTLVCNYGLRAVYFDRIIRWWYSNLGQGLLQTQALLLIVMYLIT